MTALQNSAPLVIIGAGLAGWTTAREFRKLAPEAPITLITADGGDFYAKPSLSNAYGQRRSPAQLVSTPAAQMAQTLQVTLLAHQTVQALDTVAQTLTLAGKTLAYSQLVLATGARPTRLPLQGNGADAVWSINSLDDFTAFHTALGVQPGESATEKTVLILGAGLIGCEFANDLLQAGVRVHVVDPATRPLSLLVPTGAGEQLREALQAQGLQWHLGTTVGRVDQRALGGFTAELADGSTVEADQVLSAVGLRPDIALAQEAGLQCERGIVVNELLQTSVPHVFALGDCAQYASAGQRTLPYVMPIMNAARALAATLAGTPTPLVFPLMPVSVKTPALPMVVATPHPAQVGAWEIGEGEGLWQFLDSDGLQHGFVLTGKSTARRMEQSKLTRG